MTSKNCFALTAIFSFLLLPWLTLSAASTHTEENSQLQSAAYTLQSIATWLKVSACPFDQSPIGDPANEVFYTTGQLDSWIAAVDQILCVETASESPLPQRLAQLMNSLTAVSCDLLKTNRPDLWKARRWRILLTSGTNLKLTLAASALAIIEVFPVVIVPSKPVYCSDAIHRALNAAIDRTKAQTGHLYAFVTANRGDV